MNITALIRLSSRTWLVLITALLGLTTQGAHADKMCGDDGVWIQILGAGGPEIDDGRRGTSFLIWNDGKARIMIDSGPGASVGFDQAEADFADLYAIAYTHLHTDHSADFPALIKGSYFLQRTEPLIVLGPDSNNPDYPDTETWVSRMIGPEGAYAYLKDYLTFKSGAYRVRPRNVPSTGKRKWARFGNAEVKLSAIPVNHGPVPAIAWRVEIGDRSAVFTGDFNNLKNVMPEFASQADALVVNHAIPENARGSARDLHIRPSQIGRIAKQADVRMVIMAHRMNRTLGRENQSRGHVEENYTGFLLFANDGECWGL